MIKIITAMVFLLAFASQTFYKAFIVFDYVANTKAYARFCENKARPKMHCNGKCQMMKKLKDEEKKEAQNSERKSENKNENLISDKSIYTTLHLFYAEPSQEFYTKTTSGSERKMPRSHFHPPSPLLFI